MGLWFLASRRLFTDAEVTKPLGGRAAGANGSVGGSLIEDEVIAESKIGDAMEGKRMNRFSAGAVSSVFMLSFQIASAQTAVSTPGTRSPDQMQMSQPPPPPNQAVADGRVVFRKCQACHSLEPGRVLVGPSLSGVFGRHSGSVPGFNYSAAMKQANLV